MSFFDVTMTINNALTTAPLFFVRSGDVGNYWNGSGWTSDYSKLQVPGNEANYWSRSSYSSSDFAFLLNFDSGTVGPSYNFYRYAGYSLRCLYAI